ncbi:MAG TPA: PRC-barrel domain-containing protein [Limnochordia bacterium]|nr:PRC-barrel domain-containing protein [Limnochordia bacterium]
MRNRTVAPPSGTPLDDAHRLYEFATRDLWQRPVLASDGRPFGTIIRQIIEPEMYTIRYLIVYDTLSGRHFLVPASAIVDIDTDGVKTDISPGAARHLPDFAAHLAKADEDAVYAALGRVPHWIEEAALANGRADLP